MPDRMPDRMPEDIPDRMRDRMPEDMPDRMPDRMPEDMSDRMPEDLPVRKCINVMVGITRSKVIFLLHLKRRSSAHEKFFCFFGRDSPNKLRIAAKIHQTSHFNMIPSGKLT